MSPGSGPPTAERRPAGNRAANLQIVDHYDDGIQSTGGLLLEHVSTPDAERAFLGSAMLGSPDAAVELPTLTEQDFTDPRHARVFEALVSLQSCGVGLDQVLVLAELRNLGHVERWPDGHTVGLFLADLVGATCPGPSAPYYAAIIREATARRRVQVAAERLAQAAERSGLSDMRLLVVDEFDDAMSALNRVVRS